MLFTFYAFLEGICRISAGSPLICKVQLYLWVSVSSMELIQILSNRAANEPPADSFFAALYVVLMCVQFKANK